KVDAVAQELTPLHGDYGGGAHDEGATPVGGRVVAEGRIDEGRARIVQNAHAATARRRQSGPVVHEGTVAELGMSAGESHSAGGADVRGETVLEGDVLENYQLARVLNDAYQAAAATAVDRHAGPGRRPNDEALAGVGIPDREAAGRRGIGPCRHLDGASGAHRLNGRVESRRVLRNTNQIGGQQRRNAPGDSQGQSER